MARPPLPPPEPMRLVQLAEIASGGMGSVHLARAEGGRLSGQVLAIKRLHPNIAKDPQFVGMFLDEAWMTAALRSPHVVQVAAWGEDERGMYLAVELVRGVSLARLIKEAHANEEPFAERTVAFIGSQICAGLAAAHGAMGPDGRPLGLVHRDLTPGNVLVGFDGIVKIADFGIAKAEERITHTLTGTLKGKPAYMAPEQARGGKLDHRADIFSFGVMLFEMLAGRRPWLSKGTFEVMIEVAQAPTPDLATIRRGVNPLFVQILNRCLEKNAADRWASADEIRQALDAWRASKGFAADDRESLSRFVQRNATKQIAWFEQALRGELAQSGAPTFQELEEKIDDARREHGRPSGIRPAAGAPPPPPPSRPDRIPLDKRIVPGATPSVPSVVGPSSRPVLERLPAPPPSRPGPPVPTPALDATTSDLDRTVALGGSGPPMEAATLPDPRRMAKQASVGGTVPLPSAVERGLARAPMREANSAADDLDLMATAPLGRRMLPAVAAPPASAPEGPRLGIRDTGQHPVAAVDAPAHAPSTAATPTKRSWRLGWALLVAVPLLAGGAFAAYRFRDWLFRSHEGDAQRSAPLAPEGR